MLYLWLGYRYGGDLNMAITFKKNRFRPCSSALLALLCVFAFSASAGAAIADSGDAMAEMPTTVAQSVAHVVSEAGVKFIGKVPLDSQSSSQSQAGQPVQPGQQRPGVLQWPLRSLRIGAEIRLQFKNMPRYKSEASFQHGKTVELYANNEWNSRQPFCTIVNRGFFFDSARLKKMQVNFDDKTALTTSSVFELISIKGRYDDIGIPTVINHSFFLTVMLLRDKAGNGNLVIECYSHAENRYGEISLGQLLEVFGDNAEYENLLVSDPGEKVEDESDREFVIEAERLRNTRLHTQKRLVLRDMGLKTSIATIQDGRVLDSKNNEKPSRQRPYCQIYILRDTSIESDELVIDADQQLDFHIIQAGYARSIDPLLYYGNRGFSFGGVLKNWQGRGQLEFECRLPMQALYPRRKDLEQALRGVIQFQFTPKRENPDKVARAGGDQRLIN